MSGKVDIKLLDFAEEKKDLYIESMKLINNEIDQKQFIKDQMYYDMVRSIYINEFEKLEADESLFNNGIYQGTLNNNLLGIYVDSAVSLYKKLGDLNKYFGYNFKPFDEVLANYISTQYINYFNKRNMFENEKPETFLNKMIPNIKEYKHHPFKRINSDVYKVEEVNGINVYLNDLIYKSKKSNKEICNTLNISLDKLVKIRLGEVIYTKDILYMIFLGLELSKYEIIQFINKSFTTEEYSSLGGFNTNRDKEILNIINDVNIFKNADNDNNSIIEIVNNLLKEKNLEPLNTNIVEKECKQENVKTILLIGGFGFIGRRCIEFFKKSSDGTSYKICVLAKNIPNDLSNNIICYQGDITNELVYERILSENKIDYIINLAAISTIAKGDEHFQNTLMINEQAPNALHSAILNNNYNVKCVIFPSTVQVYSGSIDDKSIKYSENSIINAAKIQNDYAYSKFQAEQNCLRYAQKGVPIIITRLSNIYGASDTNHRLIPQIIKCINNNQPVSLYVDELDNTKTPIVNLLYIDDVMLSFKKIFKRMEENPILYNALNPEDIIVNIANNKEYSIREVVEKIYKLYNKDINVELIKKPLVDTKPIDVLKAKNDFDFNATYTLNKGLKKVLNINNKRKD